MYTVGLTGGIGSGKSLVANIFRHLGTPVFDADTESKKILDENPEMRVRLSEWFGRDIYKDGSLDRAKLAGIIFTDPESLARVNGLVHPLVSSRFIDWCKENQHRKYLIHEAAILFESGFYKYLDTIIVVTAPENIRIHRVMNRDKATMESVRQRIQNQWTDEQRIPLAGYTIINDGDTALIPRILEIHNDLIIRK